MFNVYAKARMHTEREPSHFATKLLIGEAPPGSVSTQTAVGRTQSKTTFQNSHQQRI